MTAPIRGLLLDLDGTVFQDGALIPGVKEALASLDVAGMPYRFATNMSQRSRREIAGWLSAMGLDVPPGWIFTSPMAGLVHLEARGLSRVHALLNDRVLEEDLGLASVDETPDAVLVGDAERHFGYERLDAIFRMLMDGVPLVALARNRYYRREGRLVLDLGPFVAALEYATGREATIVGKPSTGFFDAARALLGLPPENVLVIGDDLEGDVSGAQRAGMRGVLVQTGKYRAGDEERFGVAPDAVLTSLSEIGRLLRD
ncbi:MAG: TIGR01458 family HAD-type hydrolase [Acidobacteria bacterium]|nr:TIGR01458 family HAD-type hydrolase [Acidobacteriota bacterium]